MRLFADADVHRHVVERLRRDGHSVVWMAEDAPGALDDVVLRIAHETSAVLITADKDFGELVVWQGRLTTGVMLIRLAGLSPEAKAEIVSAAVRDHEPELPGAFTVVSPGNIRIRRLDP
jgi:predicted nuclease of predicted toxin-antitoxin system